MINFMSSVCNRASSLLGIESREEKKRIERENLARIAEEGFHVSNMVESTGWKMFEASMKSRFESLQEDLRNEDDIEKIPSLQARLREIESMQRMVKETIEHGRWANEQLVKESGNASSN